MWLRYRKGVREREKGGEGGRRNIGREEENKEKKKG
jgi:hypothetical protein